MSLLTYYLAKFIKKSRLAAVRCSDIHETSKIESGTSFVSSKMKRYSFCGYDCEIYNANIGAFTSIANGVVLGGARHPMEWVGMSPVFYAGRDSITKKFAQHELLKPDPINIGNDVWVGRSAIVLSGVSIGNGAVVGAGSVVTKDVPPYAIVAGNPAKLIRYRFDEHTIEKLGEMEWWNLTEKELEILGKDFNNIANFMSSYSAKVARKYPNNLA